MAKDLELCVVDTGKSTSASITNGRKKPASRDDFDASMIKLVEEFDMRMAAVRRC